MTGWIIYPFSNRSQMPKFQCLLLECGRTPEWCEGEGLTSLGGSWMPDIGGGTAAAIKKSSALLFVHRDSRLADFTGQRAAEILFKPKGMYSNTPLCTDGGSSSTAENRISSAETRGQIPVLHPFQGKSMRRTAKSGEQARFISSFGQPTDPFPTLLTSGVNAFSLWYGNDYENGYIRFVTPTESERLMGLPDGWTALGHNGESISDGARYKALGNSIAVPCAEFIMAGIAEQLQ